MHFSLSDCLLDLVQNSIEAGAGHIGLDLNESESLLAVDIVDDGCGMTEEEMERAIDPFFTDGKKHAHRRIGLGLPFLVQTVSAADGDFEMKSEKGKGTELRIRFNLENVDTPPVGNLVSLIYQALCFDGIYDLTAVRSRNGERSYCINRKEMLDVLGDLNSIASLELLREYIMNQEEELLTQAGHQRTD